MKFGIKKVLLITLIAVAGFGTYRLGMHIFGTQQFHFSLDPKLSASTQKAIKQAVYESYITSLSALSDVINKACPALEQISIERRANNKLYITAKSMDPYVCIKCTKPVRVDPSTGLRMNSGPFVSMERSEWRNRAEYKTSPLGSYGASIEANGVLPQAQDECNTLVLTTTGIVLDKSCFTNEVLQPLPVIIQKNLLGKATITDEFKRWLLRLDPSVFAFYEIVWTDDFSIELHDKHNEKQTIVCSVFAIPDKNKRDLCQQIFDEKIICAQGTARKYAYTADIRFENQIIICSHKGGAVHG